MYPYPRPRRSSSWTRRLEGGGRRYSDEGRPAAPRPPHRPAASLRSRPSSSRPSSATSASTRSSRRCRMRRPSSGSPKNEYELYPALLRPDRPSRRLLPGVPLEPDRGRRPVQSHPGSRTPQLDAQIMQGAIETDTNKRKEIYAKLQKEIMEKAYILPNFDTVLIRHAEPRPRLQRRPPRSPIPEQRLEGEVGSG